jgi:hypothetical protein
MTAVITPITVLLTIEPMFDIFSILPNVLLGSGYVTELINKRWLK